jgi:hypothetical protein
MKGQWKENINNNPDSSKRDNWNSRGRQQQQGCQNRWKHQQKSDRKPTSDNNRLPIIGTFIGNAQL